MNLDDTVLDLVRGADPIDPTAAAEWSRSDDARHVLDGVLRSDGAAPSARTGRRVRRLIVASLVVTGGVTSAAAAASILGSPAPDRVRDHLASLDEGMPDDLRLDPDLDRARAVAATASGVLYAADLRDGGYCFEIVSDADRPRGAVCVTSQHLGDRALEVTAPIPSGAADALLVGGRINDERVQNVVARYTSGRSDEVELGLDRFWLLEIPAGEHDRALEKGLVVAGVDAGGRDVFTLAVPPLRDDDPAGTRLDDAQPIFVSTISDGNDLAMVLGVEGSVNVADAATLTLELEYPDGTTTTVSLADDGTYRFTVPTGRQHDFATANGRLVARDAAGNIVATGRVTSVANSRRSR
jgi:hypothetical protein